MIELPQSEKRAVVIATVLALVAYFLKDAKARAYQDAYNKAVRFAGYLILGIIAEHLILLTWLVCHLLK